MARKGARLIEPARPRNNLFDLTSRVAVITGGAGLLGEQHARAIASEGGIPVLVDVSGQGATERAERISTEYRVPAWGCRVDITKHDELQGFLAQLLDR